MAKRHLHIFVGGPPASGRTTLAKFFKEQGKNAFDGDLYIGMWLDKNGKRLNAPQGIGRNVNKWANQHRLTWTCDEDKFNKLLKSNKNKELYLFAGPVPNHLDRFFDRLFWLYADKKLVLKRIRLRLKDKDSYHSFGGTKVQREKIMSMVGPDNRDARKEGYEFVDASLTPKEIFRIITKKVGSKSAKLSH